MDARASEAPRVSTQTLSAANTSNDDDSTSPQSKTTVCGESHSIERDTARRKASLRKAVPGREVVRDHSQTAKSSHRPGTPQEVEVEVEAETEAEADDRQGERAGDVASSSDGRSEISDVTPWPALDDPDDGSNEDESAATAPSAAVTEPARSPPPICPRLSPIVSYKSTSTTDDDEGLHMQQPSAPGLRANLPLSTGSNSFFSRRAAPSKRRPSQVARSPLSYSTVGLSTSSVAATEADWDYSETETWGWIVLAVTWFVFVTGMGSCFGVWSWAWDVGTTPYAPPELEDDPTLPIVGYYPALIILTGIMSWIWVFFAWVGMKYFRHAKITGD